MKEGAGERGCGKRLEHLPGVNLGWLVQDAEVAAKKTPLHISWALNKWLFGAGVWASEWLKRSDFVERELH